MFEDSFVKERICESLGAVLLATCATGRYRNTFRERRSPIAAIRAQRKRQRQAKKRGRA